MNDKTMPELISDAWRRERPDLANTGVPLTFRLRALAIEIDHVVAEIGIREGIRPEDMLLIFSMRRVGRPYCLRPTDIYGILNIMSGAATYRIDRLVKQGIAERIADPNDRRGYLLCLSERGVETADRAVKSLAETTERALAGAGLDPVGIVALEATLGQLEHGWEQVIPFEENPLARRVLKPRTKQPPAVSTDDIP